METQLSLGFRQSADEKTISKEREELLRYINLKLAANGFEIAEQAGGKELVELASGLLNNFREKARRLDSAQRCPVDARIESFLNTHFSDLNLDAPFKLPSQTVILDRHGIARELSLPAGGNQFKTDIVSSYRVRNGVLHNPRADRRTTKGTFHIVEDGLPIPGDKRAVPRQVFASLFQKAMNPPQELMRLPFTSEQEAETHTWVSLLLRPLVCPEIPGVSVERTLETRFFAPGTLVSNLDFVESIFGNAGDPFIPENDSSLDVAHWSGQTGCVILAPHLLTFTKKELGLPNIKDATQRQKDDSMCWEKEGDLYNDGEAFKITCRDKSGVIVTIISDNYFGYCKKEVKTQISYAANLLGNAEEEHAGGAFVFPSWNLGESAHFNDRRTNDLTFEEMLNEYRDILTYNEEEGYADDNKHKGRLFYVPEDAYANLKQQTISWNRNGKQHEIPLFPGQEYMCPSGFHIRMEKHPSAPSWRLIGTAGEGIFCHKPCTVSGGGKSEISKSLIDYMEYGSIFVSDFDEDMKQVREIFNHDYSTRWTESAKKGIDYETQKSRDVLDPTRTLGSFIKLMTPSEEFNNEYNQWLESIPNHIYAIAFIIKRFYDADWGDDWERHFSVDYVNGTSGHELKLDDRKLVGTYLRVGFHNDRWRTFKLRQDFAAAFKVQTEDDITASTVVPLPWIEGMPESFQATAYKFAQNCEYRLFQRPDDAIHRGFDKQAEADLARNDVNFISNFEPVSRGQVEEMMEKVVDFDAFTEPMQRLLRSVKEGESEFIVCSDNPRKVGGVPTKNPRYLQDRPDMVDSLNQYIAEIGTRFYHRIPAGKAVPMPVTSILSGRRNNPPEKGKAEKGNEIKGLAVYNPIHYQELPELFMDYICSLTGKSPSTTAAGSEGALTKGPFNALRTTADLNNALVAMILTDLPGFSTAAGHVGPEDRFDHDISLLIPEVWCRLQPEDRDPVKLINKGWLEKVTDIEDENGKTLPARRLGYRITRKFVRWLFGRVFDNPGTVFDESILRPETQDQEVFAESIQYIMEAYERVATQYFDDGSIEEACPPLQALLHIMAHGNYEGHDERDDEIRDLFKLDVMLESDWYKKRLITKQSRDIQLWTRHQAAVSQYLEEEDDLDPAFKAELESRLELATQKLNHVSRPEYLDELVGTIGADPLGV